MNLYEKAAAVIAERSLAFLDRSAKRGTDPTIQDRINGMIRGPGFGEDGAMGPGQPWPPREEGQQPQTYNFRPSVNQTREPRAGERNPFFVLHETARMNDIVQACIRFRTDQVKAKKHTFVVEGDENMDEGMKAELNALAVESDLWWTVPDRYSDVDWQAWVTKLLYEVFVTDAPYAFLHPTRGGEIHSFRLIDGQSIQVHVDDLGVIPPPPEPAFSQIIRGEIESQMTRDEMIYRPMNPRNGSPYGRSPLEMCLLFATTGIRRWTRTLSWFTEGTTPDTWMQMPAGSSPEQAERWGTVLNEENRGDEHERRKIRPIPPGANPISVQDIPWENNVDEFIVRGICFSYQVNPLYMVDMLGRATADTMEAVQTDAGLEPVMSYLNRFVDDCNHRRLISMGVDPAMAILVKHIFTEDKTDMSSQKATVLATLANEALMHREAISTEILGLEPDPERAKLPWGPLPQPVSDPLGGGFGDLFSGFDIPAEVGDDEEAETEEEEAASIMAGKSELAAWVKVVKRHGPTSAKALGFVAKSIPIVLQEMIKSQLPEMTQEVAIEFLKGTKIGDIHRREDERQFQRRKALIGVAAKKYLESRKAVALARAVEMFRESRQGS